MNAKKSEDEGDNSTNDLNDSPLSANLQWESKQKKLNLDALCARVWKYFAEFKKDFEVSPENVSVTVKRHWDGETRNPQREYRDAYQHIFGYANAASIKSPLHIQQRTRKAKLKQVAKSEVVSIAFEAAGRAKAATIDESIELAKELLQDPEWSPYIAMALNFLKLSR